MNAQHKVQLLHKIIKVKPKVALYYSSMKMNFNTTEKLLITFDN